MTQLLEVGMEGQSEVCGKFRINPEKWLLLSMAMSNLVA